MSVTHKNFFIIKAENNFELGVLLGKKFAKCASEVIEGEKGRSDWVIRKRRAEKYFELTEKYFPKYVEEMKGYAHGAGVNFLDLWTISLEDETKQVLMERCTTIVTNGGKFIGHNEDWEKGYEENLCLLLKKIGDKKILEFYYINTLGGNAISINSEGFVTTSNTLTHRDKKFGIPRDVFLRYLSGTSDPENDFRKMENVPRSDGFSFNMISQDGRIWNLECTSEESTITKPTAPYVHTNHYLYGLLSFEMDDNKHGSFDRYEFARTKVKPEMTVTDLIDLTNDTSRGEVVSLMNERTIGKMIIDLENKLIKVWMKRESELGWVDYELDKLLDW